MADQSTSNPPASLVELDLRLKELEVEEKRSKLDALKREAGRLVPWWSHWNNPVALAVLAALVGYFGTVLTWSLARWEEAGRHDRNLKLEKEKSQGTLILEAMKAGVGQDQQVAANLVLLADAGVLNFAPEALKKLRERAGKLGAALPSPVPATHSELIDEKAYEKIRIDAAYAVSVLNTLFGKQLAVPAIKPTAFGDQNAYFDLASKLIHAPPAVQYMPDVTYHEVARLYQPEWIHRGESAALSESMADVLSAVVKQRRLNHTAQSADWLLAPRGVAWIRGEDVSRTTNLAPLRSLKAPGTAHDGDKQVADMKKYVKPSGPEWNGGEAHINSGIPNKAFYESAMKLGTDKAATIWVKAMVVVPGQQPTFAEFAHETIRQADTLHGADARTAVVAAWESVGVALAK